MTPPGLAIIHLLPAWTGTSVSQIWNVSFEPADGGFSTPTISNGIIYVGGGDRQLHALIATNGASLWNYTTAGGVSSTRQFPTA